MYTCLTSTAHFQLISEKLNTNRMDTHTAIQYNHKVTANTT